VNSFVKVVLDADPGKFVSGFAAADGAVGKFGATLSGAQGAARAAGNAFDAVANKAGSIGHKIAGGGAAIEASMVAAGIAAAQFQTNMLNVRTLMDQGFSDKNFRDMSQSVLDMTTRLPQGANDLAKGLYNIASSGFYGADALTVLDASARAATAGLSTTQNASTAITAVLNAYGLQAKDSTYVSDVLFQTVNKGVVTFDQLTNVIGQVVGTAAAAHSPISQVGAALATMTLSGISADEAGTSLNRVYTSLIKPTTGMTSALKSLGYESGAQAIQVDGLRTVMDKLRVASGGNIHTLLQWFSDIRAARGALALMSNEGQNYARVAHDIEDKNRVSGSTARAFAIQGQSAANAWARLTNSIHAFAIEIGTYLLPAATVVMNVLSEVTNFFAAMPEPMKAVIAYAGVLAGALMIVGGMLLAWKVKNIITQLAINKTGEGMVYLAEKTNMAGTAFERAGQKMATQSGPWAITRAMFTMGGASAGTFATHMASLGVRLQETESRIPGVTQATTFLGVALETGSRSGNLFSMAMGKIKEGALSVASHLGIILAAVMAVTSAYMSSKQAAADYVDSITKNMNKEDPASLLQTYDKLNNAYDAVYKKAQRSQDSPGGFLTQFAKDLGDLATNVVGIDVIKDSTWDNFFKAKGLAKSADNVKMLIGNLAKNVTEIYNQMHPDNKVQVLDMKSQDFATIARAAEKMGVDLTNSFDSSSGARTRVFQDVAKLESNLTGLSVSANSVTDAMISAMDELQKEQDKAAKGAADAFTKSADLVKAIDPTMTWGKLLGTDSQDLVSIGDQITYFYTTTIGQAKTFYDNIEELQRRGMNPASIQKFLQAGPEAAGAIVQAAVDDASGGITAVISMGEAALEKFATRAAEMAALTQKAIQDPTLGLTQLLPQAQSIADQMMTQGKLATVDTIAKALSMDPDSVRSIATKFGLVLSEAPDIGKALVDKLFGTGPGYKAGLEHNLSYLKDDLTNLYGVIVSFSGATPAQAQSVIKSLSEIEVMPHTTPSQIADKQRALKGLIDSVAAMDGLTATDKTFIIKLIGDEEAKTKMREFLDTAFGAHKENIASTSLNETQIAYVLSLIGQPDAVQKFLEFAATVKLVPGEIISTLNVLGTPEAKAKAEEFQRAIDMLQGKDVPVTLDNIQALIKAGFTQAAIDAIKQHNPVVLYTDAEKAINQVGALQYAIDNLHGKTLEINALTMQPTGGIGVSGHYDANGNFVANAEGGIHQGSIKAYAEGGMREAMVGDGKRSILWNEPSTEGESYIPWAKHKRRRALHILGVTADAFGMDLVPQGTMSFAAGGMNGPIIPSGRGRGMVLQTSLNFHGPVYGESSMRDAVKDMITQHDRDLGAKMRGNRTGVN